MIRSVLDNPVIDLWPRGLLPPRLRIRLYDRLRRILLSRLPKHSAGVEIGVWMGDFSQQILSFVEPCRLHLIDPWVSQPLAEDNLYHAAQSQMDLVYERVVNRFAGDDRVVIHRGFSA